MHAKYMTSNLYIIPVTVGMVQHLVSEGDPEVHKQQADALNGQPV